MGLGLLTAFGLFGCGSATPPDSDSGPNAAAAPMPGTNDPSWLTSREKMPPPDTDRIEYDAENLTLTFYGLPAQDTWIVQLPNEKFGRPEGSQHHLPKGVDTSRTLVYYNRAGMKMSAPVTVAQIEAGRTRHTSLAIGP
jgi:hypothetical protein